MKEKIKKCSRVLLLGKSKSYLVEAKGEFHCQFGKINMESVVGKDYGCRVKSGLGEQFSVVQPNLNDFLAKGTRRLPQVVLPKDAALILAIAGINKSSAVLDAGSGSGFLAMFLANHAKKVYTYEKRKDFFAVARQNIKNSGLKNIAIRNKDIAGSKEKNVDLVCLDLECAEQVVAHAFKALKAGGWIAVFSPYIEQVTAVVKEIRRYNFAEPKIIENFQKEWQVQLGKEAHTRPKTHTMHTGFLIFARKL